MIEPCAACGSDLHHTLECPIERAAQATGDYMPNVDPEPMRNMHDMVILSGLEMNHALDPEILLALDRWILRAPWIEGPVTAG